MTTSLPLTSAGNAVPSCPFFSSEASVSNGSKPRVSEAFESGRARPNAHSHTSHQKKVPKITPSGRNAVTHQALRTPSRICDESVGSQRA